MKKVKEMKGKLKQYLATLMIVTLVGANMSLPSLAAAKSEAPGIVIEHEGEAKKEISLKKGDETELSVAFATPASASEEVGTPAEATATWTSSNKNVVDILSIDAATDSQLASPSNAVRIEAVGAGTATITATTPEGKTATCTVTVPKEPSLNVSPDSKTIAYKDEVRITAEIERLPKSESAEFNATVTKGSPYGLDIEDEGDGVFTLTPALGLSGEYTVMVTADVDGYDLSKAVTITVKEPVLKLDGSNKLDLKENPSTTLSLDEENSEYSDYEEYKWSVKSGTAVEIALPANEATATINAKEAGTAVITLVASTPEKSGGPDTESGAIPAAEATVDFKVIVSDSREFAVDPKFNVIELDINSKDAAKQKLSETIKVINDFEDTTAVIENDTTKEITTVVNEDNSVTISVPKTLKTAGSASLVLSSNGAGESVRIKVIILNSEILLDVNNGVKIETSVPEPNKPSMNTDNMDITEEQKAELQKSLDKQVAKIKNSIKAALEAAASGEFNKTLKEAVNVPKTVLDKLVKTAGITLKDGESANVYPKQKLETIEMESDVKMDADGNPFVTAVIKSLTFDIDLFLEKVDPNGVPYETTQFTNFTGNTETISVPIPLPSTQARYVYVKELGKKDNKNSYFEILEEGGNKYTIIETLHFSRFTLEFADSLPTSNVTPPSGGSSSGGRGYSSTAGKWMQDSMGWRYKSTDGTWPVNTWKSLLWNNTMQWYRFNPQGYMVSGWFTDIDGNKYFMHNIPDGQQGHMYTGWHQIEGKWYYFRASVGGPQGSLLMNGVTPDGYTVDENGVSAGYPNIK